MSERRQCMMVMKADYATGMIMCQNVATHDFSSFENYEQDVKGIYESNEDELKILLAFLLRKETGRMIDYSMIEDLEVIFIEKNDKLNTEIAFRFQFDWNAIVDEDDDETDELIIIKDEFQF